MSRAFGILLLLASAAPASAQLAPVASFEAARDVALRAGGWTYRVLPSGSEAMFAGAFAIGCDRSSRTVALSRTGQAASPMTISTDSLARTFGGGALRLRASDPLLDAIAYSRGRFVVSGGGGEMLVLPASPEAARSIEDCRN